MFEVRIRLSDGIAEMLMEDINQSSIFDKL